MEVKIETKYEVHKCDGRTDNMDGRTTRKHNVPPVILTSVTDGQHGNIMSRRSCWVGHKNKRNFLHVEWIYF